MQGAAVQGIMFVTGLVIAATAFILVVFAVNSLLSPRKPSSEKNSPFECGVEQAGEAWTPPRMRFSVIAMIFVLFDAEAILLFAVASVLRGHALAAVEVGAFVLFLASGLGYAWKKGALEWRL
jgi:NADH-quinone oxidoreductase subunit A